MMQNNNLVIIGIVVIIILILLSVTYYFMKNQTNQSQDDNLKTNNTKMAVNCSCNGNDTLNSDKRTCFSSNDYYPATCINFNNQKCKCPQNSILQDDLKTCKYDYKCNFTNNCTGAHIYLLPHDMQAICS